MIYESTMRINDYDLKAINDYLSGKRELNEDDTIIHTSCFADGKEMDIKCCGAKLEEGGAWTEAVLFNEYGDELCCTDVGEEYTGQWILKYDGNTYVCNVK